MRAKRQRTVVRVFLASPSDVAAERLIVERVVGELNSSIAPKIEMLLELVRWEDMVPSIGRPQQVILDQADIESCDVFIGILWNKFGTPTGRAVSGTEEEFELAYQSWKKSGTPHIMFYFCQRPANFQRPVELEQKRKVLEFRERLSGMGIFVTYDAVADFETRVRQDLTKHLLTLSSAKGSADKEATRSKIGQASPRTKKTTNHTPPPGMIRIEAGEFLVGRVLTKAKINYDFWIDETPVTNQQFMRFVEATGFMVLILIEVVKIILHALRERAASYPEHPVTMVTWFDAEAYAAWLGKRLPTDRERERATAGKMDASILGEMRSIHHCAVAQNRPLVMTTPVFKHPKGRSPEACYVLAGNVFEWVSDWSPTPRFSSAPNSEKINRGGLYARSADDLVGWYSESDPPALRMSDVGFRCVWTPKSL